VADDDQFLSFEDALDQLRLQEEELKRLVSEGEIRAFREGDTMKLRAQDVETLREELTSIPDEGTPVEADITEEIVFEDDADIVDEAGMATEEITDVETILQEDDDIEEIELEEEAVLTDTAVRKRSPRAAVVVEEGDETESGVVKTALVLTSIIMILGIPVAMSVATDQVSSLARAIAGPLDFDNALPAIDNR
jgi:hypothetical protein